MNLILFNYIKHILRFLIVVFIVSFTDINGQSTIDNLSFVEGKWKATSADSSFSSILEYSYSPEKLLFMTTNHLYDNNGNLFLIYEGVYLQDESQLIYIVSGPKGELHKGSATFENGKLVHLAKVYPGTEIKSYKSEINTKDGKLYYYANYSNETEFPKDLDYSAPLVYERIKN